MTDEMRYFVGDAGTEYVDDAIELTLAAGEWGVRSCMVRLCRGVSKPSSCGIGPRRWRSARGVESSPSRSLSS